MPVACFRTITASARFARSRKSGGGFWTTLSHVSRVIWTGITPAAFCSRTQPDRRTMSSVEGFPGNPREPSNSRAIPEGVVFEPLYYSSLDTLVSVLDTEIIGTRLRADGLPAIRTKSWKPSHGTDSSQTHCWREPDSNHRSRSGGRSLGCCRREMPDR